jgi:hypothetical protein
MIQGILYYGEAQRQGKDKVKKSTADQDVRPGRPAPGRRAVLVSIIFFSWLVGSAAFLYVSNTRVDSAKDKVKPPAPAAVDDTEPFSTSQQVGGRSYVQFQFPSAISIGTVGPIQFKPLAGTTGKTILSATEVVRGKCDSAQGMVKYPRDQHLSFTPGPVIAVNPSYLSHFRPGEIFDVTMQQMHDVDTDVFLEACSQLRRVTRLDLSACTDLTVEGLPVIDEYDSLKQLSLMVTRDRAPLIAKLATIKKVTSLSLFGRVDLYPILNSLRYCTNLKALKIVTGEISPASIICIATMGQLQELSLASDIFEDPKTTNTSLKTLSKLPGLKVLILSALQKNKLVRTNASTAAIIQTFKMLEILQLNGKNKSL